MADPSCAFCGAALIPSRRRFCDLKCAQAHNAAVQRERYKADPEFFIRRSRQMRKTSGARRTCPVCSRPFRCADKRRGIYCSIACTNRGRVHPKPFHQRTKWVKAQKRLTKIGKGSAGKWVFVQGICHECGDYFVGRRRGVASPHCSSKCSAAVSRRLRRARKAGVEISRPKRFQIHERDGWICHICGDMVNRDAKVPALDAAVLDHVIALAKGGAHHEDNLKTAHHWCNCVKSDKPLADVA